MYVVSQTTGLLCKVTFPGTWKVEDESVVLDTDKPEIESETVVATRGMQTGPDGAEFKPWLVENLKKQLNLNAPMKVVSIEEDDLTLDINGKPVEFDREDKDYDVKSKLDITENMKKGVAHMDGAIGKYAIEMELVAMPDGKVAGRYRYNRIGQWLLLNGRQKADGTVDLTEKTTDGMITGHYTGKITNGPGKKVKFAGQFDSYQGKSYTFDVKGEYEDANPEIQYTGDDSFGADGLLSDDDDDSDISDSGSSDWDDILDEYEEYVDKLIALMPKIKNSDPAALAEYADVTATCVSLSEKLQNAKGDLSQAQLARLTKISGKYANLASQLPDM